MRYWVIATLLASAVSLVSSQVVAAPAASLDDRVKRLERMADNNALLNISNQLQLLQKEIQALRGEMEVLGREMTEMKERQKSLYEEMDRRVQKLEVAYAQPAHRESAANVAPNLSDGTTPNRNPSIDTVAQRQAATSGQTAGGGNFKSEAEAYQGAFDLLKDGRYQQAADAFSAFLVQYPKGTYTDNAQYWLGESNYVIRNFDVAELDFKKVIEQHSASPKVPDALLKIGYIHYEKGDWAKANETLQQVRARFPGTTAASLAQNRLMRMKREGH